MNTFTHAIVRPPASNFAEGLTDARMGRPDITLARQQHARYCEALEHCGLALVRLPDDPKFPDSTFVEDPAVVTSRGAVMARPGAPSRRGEVISIGTVIDEFFDEVASIRPPGALDGGDVCQAGSHFFIGVSTRTNPAGAAQLATILSRWGFTSTTVDIRGGAGILHLKSGVSYLGDSRLVITRALAERSEFGNFELVRVDPSEDYGANLLRIGEHVIMSAGNTRLASALQALGYPILTLDMSEFRKMDGALTCLSLRF